jgi:hypothetical protein
MSTVAIQRSEPFVPLSPFGYPSRCRSHVPGCGMGSTALSGRINPEPASELARQSKIVRTCLPLWQFRFQHHSFGTARYQSPSPPQVRQTSQLGLPWRGRLVCKPIHGALSVLQVLSTSHKLHQRRRHCHLFSETVSLSQKYFCEDYLKQAAADMLAILTKPPTSVPFLQYGDGT